MVGLGYFHQSLATRNIEQKKSRSSHEKNYNVEYFQHQYLMPGLGENLLHRYGGADAAPDVTNLIALMFVTLKAVWLGNEGGS